MLTYAGHTFKNKTALHEHLCKAIGYKTRVLGREFFDEVLAAVFTERSYRFRGLRPTAFAYVPNEPGGDRPYGDSLAANVPGFGWCRFSTGTLLRDGAISFDSKFASYCRERFVKVWRPRLFAPGPCVVPGCGEPGTDVDHIAPQHREIVTACLPLVTDDLRDAWTVWVEEKHTGRHFVLPEGHPATVEYDRLTQSGSYQRLCGPHHDKITGHRARKSAPKTKKKVEVIVDPNIDDLFNDPDDKE